MLVLMTLPQIAVLAVPRVPTVTFLRKTLFRRMRRGRASDGIGADASGAMNLHSANHILVKPKRLGLSRIQASSLYWISVEVEAIVKTGVRES